LTASRTRAAVRKSAWNRFQRSAFDAGPFGNAAHGRHVDSQLGTVLAGNTKAAHGKIALGHAIDLPVRAIKRGQDQRPAAQGLGLANGRNGDVDMLAGLGKGGQLGRDQHGGRVFQPRRNAQRQLHPQPPGGAAHGLGEVFQIVIAGAIQAHDHAIAGQLVGPHALKRADVAHALGMNRGGHEGGQHGGQHGGQNGGGDEREKAFDHVGLLRTG